ncbi:MAG: glycosyltransferase [Treponemataceae bacterium]|nr:glycosyltransferase [Treponemataceae bacterium]
MKDTKIKYLKTKSLFCPSDLYDEKIQSRLCGGYKVNKSFHRCFPITVCIPAYNEYPNIISTLQSLALSSAVCNVKVQAIICVNNRMDSSIEIKQNNHYLVEMLDRISKNEFFVDENSSCGVKISVIDYTHGENQFEKGYGVGWARKIAMDYALAGGAQVIACLDADTLVSEDYCGELNRFLSEKMDFASMDFIHQGACSAELQESINHYEFWMKDHSKKLKECGTPFHYMALGSLIIVSSELYAQSCGMKNRLAGEDFYFIQECIKILLTRADTMEKIKNPLPQLHSQVYPEARISDRVLFGTGKTLNQVKYGNKNIRFYLDSSYKEIESFIELFDSLNEKGLALDFPREVLCRKNKLSEFLIQDNFFNNWNLMIKNAKNNPVRNAASFHCKFDGLKIIRAIHYIEK